MSAYRWDRTPTVARAFTLLEVIVAMTVLAAGIMAVLGAFSISSSSATRHARLRGAVSVAESQMELAIADAGDALEPVSGQTNQYKWSVRFESRPDSLAAALVTVTWPEQGQEESYQLSRVFRPRQQPAASQ